MCYSAMAVANFFIEKSQRTNIPVSNMHLQKMVFFAHAIYFKQTEQPLFSDPVVAWQHGPVVESLYHELKHYGNSNIKELISRLESCRGKFFPKLVTPVIPENSDEVSSFLNQVWNALAKVETWRLRALSHAEGGAWFKTVKGQGIDPMNDQDVKEHLPRNLTILDSVIQECGR